MKASTIAHTRYFYFRDKHNRPLVTVAMLERSDGAIAYGWAICGPHDRPRYGLMQIYTKPSMAEYRDAAWVSGGKTIAYGRAEAAFHRGTQIRDGVWKYPRTIARPEALRVIEACEANGLLALVWHDTTTALPKTMQPPAKEVS